MTQYPLDRRSDRPYAAVCATARLVPLQNTLRPSALCPRIKFARESRLKKTEIHTRDPQLTPGLLPARPSDGVFVRRMNIA